MAELECRLQEISTARVLDVVAGRGSFIQAISWELGSVGICLGVEVVRGGLEHAHVMDGVVCICYAYKE